jgi:hypothetical protein
MIELEKTGKDKKKITVKKKSGKSVHKKVDVVQSRFYDELKIAETENVHIGFENLVEEISKQKRRFAQNPTYEELKIYKSMVMEFMKHVTDHMLAVEHRTGGSPMRQKIYSITKLIDKKLESLTKLVLTQQAQNITLLATLDEIRGLLIDLYK